MPLPLQITLLRDPALAPDDRIELEVDDVVLVDRVRAWPTPRLKQGFGMTPAQAAGFGFTPALPFGTGIFGAGYLGEGATTFTHTTLARYPTGSYQLRVRAHDALGNAGDWSDPVTIAHAAPPDPPRNLTLDEDDQQLTWDWP